jgi:membrane protein DedA with SNARE-associated domain
LASDGEPGLADDLILKFGYFGIFFVLVLGGLGLPVPEEAPIILAGILARKGTMHWIPALASSFAGVLVGDFVVYFLGYFYGEKVLSLPLTRKFLTKAREAQIKGYFHRHGVKILILGRFAVGFRTAAYLTAGILRLPTLKLFLTDLFAASLSTLLMFWLAYAFASQVEQGFQEAKHYITPALGLVVSGWLLHRYVKARLRAGQRVGPPVLDSDDVPLPPDDLHSKHDDSRENPILEVHPLSEELNKGASIEPGPVAIAPDLPAVVDPSLSHHPPLESGSLDRLP